MQVYPCNVCGSTDLNLIDGFYYCVECGTQDVNVRETIVERSYFADGTRILSSRKKFSTIVKDGIQMSGEWYKWHAYNFILAGLTDELISLGAKPRLKIKVLWIWARYIKQFQVKEEAELKSTIRNISLNSSRMSQAHSDSGNSEPEEESEVKNKKHRSEKFTRDIKIVTKGLLLAILYVALNLDKSDIQLSHLFRFIKEGRLSFLNCVKYVPKEIDTKLIPHWKSFLLCQSDYNSHTIRAYAMTCIKVLDLGLTLVPDFKNIINNYITELCLPSDLKNLIFSLMVYHPYDYLDIDRVTKKFLVRIPDYEGVAMSYVLVALKMCFGLDCDYEVRISDAVDKINSEENYLKSHKLGMYSEPTERLFSFREWTRFLQFRKTVLCQHYLPMARQHNQEVDDYILMEHLEARNMRPIKLRDEVTMDILNKIPSKNDISVINKSEFLACLTPMSTYTDVIVNYVLDDELRLLLSEDFTQYSLKYAIENLELVANKKYSVNLIVGISESNKLVQSVIKGHFESKKSDTAAMVFVRNCQNKNWLKTNPPAAEHIKKVSENETSDKESDHGYDSNFENSLLENDGDIKDDKDIKLESFEEENENTNIFDDNFDNLIPYDKTIIEPYSLNNDDFNNSNIDVSQYDSYSAPQFDTDNFDKAKIIDDLVLLACKKYKIPLPKEHVAREPRKRRNQNSNMESGECAPKRKRPTKSSEVQMKVNDMIAAYYNLVARDELTKVTEQIRHAVEAVDNTNEDVYNATSAYIHTSNGEIENDTLPEPENTNFDQNVNSLILNTSELLVHSDEVNTEGDEYLNERITKDDPNFDAETHDISQLYVKLKDDAIIDEFIRVANDSDVDRIINNKIKEFSYYDKIHEITVKDETLNYKDHSDTDEDEVDYLEKEQFEEEKEETIRNLAPLIKNPLQIKEFKYWLRHYNAHSIGKNLDMHQKFDMELREKCPPSFNFVISECAGILGCTTFCLYKYMQNLEEIIIAKSKQLRI